MSYGKTLLTNLFYILILCAVGGLWYVQHHHYTEEINKKNKKIETLESKAGELASTMQEQKITQQESHTRCNKEIRLHATQLQDLKNKHDALVQTHSKTLEALEHCKRDLKDASAAMSQANTTSLVKEHKGHQCPNASSVNQFLLSEGNWSNSDFNWWFEFAFRPLQKDEIVLAPFKVLFDGTYIDCYYHVGKKDTQETIDDIWVVIKGMSPDGEIQIQNGWEPCVIEGCERKCEYKENQGCYFELQQNNH